MDINPYQIVYRDGQRLNAAEIRPCCNEDNIVDYAVYIQNKLAFNITKSANGDGRWVVSLKNADKYVDDNVVQSIGSAIDLHNSTIR